MNDIQRGLLQEFLRASAMTPTTAQGKNVERVVIDSGYAVTVFTDDTYLCICGDDMGDVDHHVLPLDVAQRMGLMPGEPEAPKNTKQSLVISEFWVNHAVDVLKKEAEIMRHLR
ncbi:MAG: hypothetical protein ACXAB9_11340 [Candidatus Thorarchaeota archaeon]|jgi:hypothetical protein